MGDRDLRAVQAELEQSPAGVGVHLQPPTAAASGDRRHDVGVGACAVGVAGHRVEQQQLDVPEMQEQVGVFGESERLLGVRAGSDPVADPKLELAEGAQRVRQIADETPVARDRDPPLELATSGVVVLHPARELAEATRHTVLRSLDRSARSAWRSISG